jgi:precorrin-2 dehydrogenase/sirohydrochlorin ferrochelatase
MGYYPIFMVMDGRPCLVVGGGEVARRKVEGLLAAGACVTVVSPHLTPELTTLRDDGRIAHVEREYREGDLEGFEMCMVATDDGAVNAAVAREGKSRRVWVNASDDPPNCDFILPSVIRRGEVVVAASTGGASPALARRLREELEAYLSEDFEALAKLLAEVRQELRARNVALDPETWQRAIDGQLRVLLAQRRYGQAKARLLQSLGVELGALEAARREA